MTRVALLFALLMLAALAVRETRLLDRYAIFFPEGELVGSPRDVGLEYEDVSFVTEDGVDLHGWFVPGRSETTLLWFHGNAGNISHRLGNLALFHEALGVNVFIFDYRGYGRSGGRPTEAGTYLDAEAALEHLRSRSGREPRFEDDLILFGRSLGCAVAVEMATRYRVRGLVLESPFTSIHAMARAAYPFLPTGVLMPLVGARYDSLAKIGAVASPLMVLHGELDEIVPMEQGVEIFEVANGPKWFYPIPGAGHNDTYQAGGSEYLAALGRFIQEPTRDPGLTQPSY